MNVDTKFISRHYLTVVMATFLFGFALIACSGTSEQKSVQTPEGIGSLSRTFKIIDEKGRPSGTLTIDPVGGVTLRDENGNIVGRFKPDTSDQTQPTETPPKPQSGEAAVQE